ncbi:acyltransferase family protein [Microbulbifer sp. OS29]|uniref:Acyltransferase family protein n=1 Tax=Microbulbifer okhotskensis TaxID=2926617 RepID=A0A9X2J379_9GAMM|nr:acyltransferase family protein [Microbulbifer okhotskensis]MCO1333267.1 acyltransferase family protein [Microbulbifer okhotskensis]
MHKNTQRRHDIDALRVLAFGLLILYHLGMAYVAEWGWHVKSDHQSESLQLLMLAVNQWRMPLLFLISGAASYFLYHKLGTGGFLLRRLKQLLIPLIFGMLVIIPPQAYFEALSNGIVEPGYLSFLQKYFSFYPWPQDAFAGSYAGLTWNHLWYLPYLACYTLAIAPIAVGLKQSQWLEPMMARVKTWHLLILPIVPMVLYGLLLYPRFGGINHAVIGDWYTHARFFTYFLFGYLLVNSPTPWQLLAKLRRQLLMAAPVSFAAFLLLDRTLPDNSFPAQELLHSIVIFSNRWLWLLLVLAYGHRFLNKKLSWLPYATEAVYPWYILHQTIIVIAVYQLSQLSLGPILEPLLALTITVSGCWLLHEFVIRRTPLLRLLFGLKPLSSAKNAPESSLIRST